jgi:predicted Zn-dependent peptidase
MGSADETLPTAGISHLLEHLALFGVGRPGDHANGLVDQTVTTFHTVGDPEQVTDFLAAVTRQLVQVPGHRLDAERGVIEAEQAGRSPGVSTSLHAWRFGAHSFGLAAQPQYGITRLGLEVIEAWAHRFATRDNAVLWLSGPPPAGLRLLLPEGGFQPPPDPRWSAMPDFPCWYPGLPGGVASLSVLPRAWAATALAHVLRSRLVDELRTLRAVAYSPDTDYQPLTGEFGRLIGFSDLVAERAVEGTEAFRTVLEQLAHAAPGEGGITEADLDEWRAALAQRHADAMMPLALAAHGAWETLFRRPVEDLAERQLQQARVTPEDVRELARTALDSALLAVPPDAQAPPTPWRRAPDSAGEPVPGRGRPHLDPGHPDARLVVIPQGLTLRLDGTAHLTARTASTAAVLRWPDGRRVVVAEDATHITVEPTLWRHGRAAVQTIDEYWPEELRIEMPARAPQEVPQPVWSWRLRRWWRVLSREWVLVWAAGVAGLAVVELSSGTPLTGARWAAMAGLLTVIGVTRSDMIRLRRI